MGLKIKQVEIYISPYKLKKPFVISLGIQHYANNVIVVIKTNKGITGFGECNPFPPINGESVDTAYVVAEYIAKELIDKNPLKLKDCYLLMDNIIYGNSSIKSAFDIALYDIASQYAELPLYAFLEGENNKELKTDYTVSIGDPEQMAKDAREIVENGFQSIKVKLGQSAELDIKRIKAIREEIGNDIPMRIDANQGWSIEEAKIALNGLVSYNILFCEEPILRQEFMSLPEISNSSSIPIMADESCCDHYDAKRLIDIKACSHFNIKLGKSSGIYKALKIIKLSEKADIQLQIGGFLESRIVFTASAHLALTSKNVLYCDFDSPLMFEIDPVINGISYDKNGIIGMPDKTGLGASVDEKYLRSLKSNIIK